MWAAAHRGRLADIEKRTRRYPTDLTDAEWSATEPLLPKPGRTGRKRRVDLREMLNAIRYLARSGVGWRMLPINFGPWQTVYRWFRRFVRRLLFQTIHDVAVMIDRELSGREASPTAGVVDSQTIKAPSAQARGYDANKEIAGRKRHIAVDTDGRLLMVNLTTAEISDSAYDRGKLMDKAAFLDFTVEIIKRISAEPGFKVLPRRWLVERTFGWMGRWRHLVRDYERRIDVSRDMIYVATGSLLRRRIHP